MKKCIKEGCYKPKYCRGLCRSHYRHIKPDLGERNNEYTIWQNMKTRCYNKKTPNYKDYGGRGIVMSEQWKDSFETFYKDMGKRPSKKHSVDRIDNNKGYSKENCRWATMIEQARNKRNSSLNKSGCSGVHMMKNGTYRVRITVNYNRIHIGCFSDINEAIKARREAEIKYWGQVQ
jgi:hypothetical protein